MQLSLISSLTLLLILRTLFLSVSRMHFFLPLNVIHILRFNQLLRHVNFRIFLLLNLLTIKQRWTPHSARPMYIREGLKIILLNRLSDVSQLSTPSHIETIQVQIKSILLLRLFPCGSLALANILTRQHSALNHLPGWSLIRVYLPSSRSPLGASHHPTSCSCTSGTKRVVAGAALGATHQLALIGSALCCLMLVVRRYERGRGFVQLATVCLE